jgi:hypothetical protein
MAATEATVHHEFVPQQARHPVKHLQSMKQSVEKWLPILLREANGAAAESACRVSNCLHEMHFIVGDCNCRWGWFYLSKMHRALGVSGIIFPSTFMCAWNLLERTRWYTRAGFKLLARRVSTVVSVSYLGPIWHGRAQANKWADLVQTWSNKSSVFQPTQVRPASCRRGPFSTWCSISLY